jgi:hypothetical protein
MHTKFQSENLKGEAHLGDVGLHGRTILKWILRKYGSEDADTNFVDQNNVHKCERANKPLASKTDGTFLEAISDYQVLKKDFASPAYQFSYDLMRKPWRAKWKWRTYFELFDSLFLIIILPLFISRQQIITSSVFKFEASSLTCHLAGNGINLKKKSLTYGHMKVL